MTLVLDLVGPLLMVAFSRSALFGGFWWLLNTLLQLVLFAPETPVSALISAPLVAAIFGIVLGVALVRLLRLPRLIDPLMMPEHPEAWRAFIPDVVLWLASVIGLGVQCIQMAQETLQTNALPPVNTTVALLIALGVFVLVTLWLLDSPFDAYTKGQNLKYTAALVVLFMLPPLAAHATHHMVLQYGVRRAAVAAASMRALGHATLVAALCHLLVAVGAHILFFWYAGYMGIGHRTTTTTAGAANASLQCGSFAVFPRYLAILSPPDSADILETGMSSQDQSMPVFVAISDRMCNRTQALVFSSAIGLCHVSFLAANILLHIIFSFPTSMQTLMLFGTLTILWLMVLTVLTVRTDEGTLVHALVILAGASSWRVVWRFLSTSASSEPHTKQSRR